MQEDKDTEIIEDTDTIETPLEDQVIDKTADEVVDSQDIDFNKELSDLEAKQPKSELEKAKKALFYNAQRLQELGGDPAEVIGIKKEIVADKPEATNDVHSEVEKEFIKRDARSLAKTDEEYKVIMWYVDNNKVSVEDAYLLAHKGRLMRTISEVQRAKGAIPSLGGGAGRKVGGDIIPTHPGEEVLQRRGYKLDPKSKTWKGKFYEEYYDQATKSWKSRKLQK